MTENGWQKSATLFIVGLGLGAGLGVLFAPKSGEETRADIANGVNDCADELVAQGKKIGRQAQQTIEDAKDQVRAIADAGSQAYKEAKASSS
ncbi:MAG TPA: YtxH domain-containing protein [Candidatus Acidoferrales bacterium]|jgi:gas vesicle protein